MNHIRHKANVVKLLTGIALAFVSGTIHAQTISTLAGGVPTPGPFDISQMSAVGNQASPDGLNYFTDNANPPGQTFTTGNNPTGYVLTNVVVKTGSLSTGGSGTLVQAAGYRLQIYSISGTTATRIGNFTVGAGTFLYTPGDWVAISGLALLLNSNSTYAYTFQRRSQGWDNMDVASGNTYGGGEIALIPAAATGTITYGGSHGFDAQFDIGLALAGPPVIGAATATPNPAYALSPVTISDSVVLGNTYQWQTNTDVTGGLGGTWVNLLGATNQTITNIPPDIFPGGSDYTLNYQLIAANGLGSVTSAPLALVVHAASSPQLVTDITPTSVVTFAGAIVNFSATFAGTTPMTNQWQTDAGQIGIFTNIPGANGATLTLTNVQAINNGNYRVSVGNSQGSQLSSAASLTVYPVLYQEGFNLPTSADQSVTNVGWRNDIQGADNRIFSGNGGLTFPNCAVYSYVGNPALEAFYATTATANGSISNHPAFPIINLATVQNLSLGVDVNINGSSTWQAFFAVQMNFGNWYVSTTDMEPQPNSTTFVTEVMPFDPSVSAWNQLTVSGTGSLNSSFPVVGGPADANLNGYITGVGIVIVHSSGGDVQFDNFTVGGSIPPTSLPVVSSPPFSQTNYTGSTASLSVTATTNGSTAGLTYQWRAAAVGSGTYSSLSDGGQFSGTTSPTLLISSVTSAANHKDYVVIVTDGAGSTTSAPPATLTVIDAPPILVSDTTIYPDSSPLFASGNVSIHAGNHNTLNLTASYTGTQPLSYQWQVSPNPDGSAAVNVLGATNSTLRFSNPQTNNTGFYSLRVSNNQSISPNNSTWVQLTVLPSDTSIIKWSAPVKINGLSASQILNGVGGSFFSAESFGATASVSVTNNGTVYVFDSSATSATLTGSTSPRTAIYTGPSTGDTNLDAVLSVDEEDSGSPTITLNNLTPGQFYSVQIFAINDTAGALRQINFSDSSDPADVSASFLMGDNAYVVGSFIATDVTHVISQHLADFHGYISAVIIRQAVPTLALNRVGSSLQLDWDFGTLLEATNINGPWTTNTTISPYIASPTGPQRYFRIQLP